MDQQERLNARRDLLDRLLKTPTAFTGFPRRVVFQGIGDLKAKKNRRLFRALYAFRRKQEVRTDRIIKNKETTPAYSLGDLLLEKPGLTQGVITPTPGEPIEYQTLGGDWSKA